MLTISSPISALNRVGRATESKFKKLGILTIEDLLSYIPFRYDDLSKTVSVSQLVPGTTQTVRVLVEQIASRRGRSGKIITEAIVADESGKIKAVWFNQPYLSNVLRPGFEVYLSGKAERNVWGISLVSPSWEPVREAQVHTGRIVPIYSTTADLTSRQIRFLVGQALPFASKMADPLPEDLRRAHGLLPLGRAIASVHFPDSWKEARAARRRISWERLFLIALRNRRAKERQKSLGAPAIPFDEPGTREFVARLSFRLTDAQRRVAWRIIRDLGKPHPMNRLLNGDVGSGKTLVAAIAAWNVARAGKQTAFMVPTEILARQHFRTLSRLLSGTGVRPALLVRSAAETVEGPLSAGTLRERISGGEVDVVVGTHALLEGKVSIPKLALAVIDEQHRFGVEQRRRLREKMEEKRRKGEGKQKEKRMLPHLLSMTATPIPRTMAMTIYGDLDLSVLDEMPPGRTPVETRLLSSGRMAEVEEIIRQAAREGHQSFVICPQIDASDPANDGAGRAGARAAVAEHRRLCQALPDLSVSLLHGRLPAAERERTMAAFAAGEIQALVSTSVVEVGVDIPNATVMVIEEAERFGLAQLHQFRGRVGRGENASLCLLVPGAECGQEGMERLRIAAGTQDGFALAEKDLELRGPGRIFGTEQSGRQADAALLSDPALIIETQEAAGAFLAGDPGLAGHPALRAELKTLGEDVHLE